MQFHINKNTAKMLFREYRPWPSFLATGKIEPNKEKYETYFSWLTHFNLSPHFLDLADRREVYGRVLQSEQYTIIYLLADLACPYGEPIQTQSWPLRKTPHCHTRGTMDTIPTWPSRHQGWHKSHGILPKEIFTKNGHSSPMKFTPIRGDSRICCDVMARLVWYLERRIPFYTDRVPFIIQLLYLRMIHSSPSRLRDIVTSELIFL